MAARYDKRGLKILFGIGLFGFVVALIVAKPDFQEFKEAFREDSDNSPPVDEWYENGQRKQHVDKKTGIITKWYENGRFRRKSHFDKKTGVSKTWHENGQLRSESHYNNKGLHGVYTAWYPNGQKESEEHYKNDWKHGQCLYWRENGQAVVAGYWRNGARHGISLSYYDASPYLRAGWTESFYFGGQLDDLWNDEYQEIIKQQWSNLPVEFRSHHNRWGLDYEEQ